MYAWKSTSYHQNEDIQKVGDNLSVFAIPTSNGVYKITHSCSEMAKLRIRDKGLAWFGPLFER